MNLKLKRHLNILDGMANVLLKQIKDIKAELKYLEDYSLEELEFYIDKIKEIDNKIFEVKKIINNED